MLSLKTDIVKIFEMKLKLECEFNNLNFNKNRMGTKN